MNPLVRQPGNDPEMVPFNVHTGEGIDPHQQRKKRPGTGNHPLSTVPKPVQQPVQKPTAKPIPPPVSQPVAKPQGAWDTVKEWDKKVEKQLKPLFDFSDEYIPNVRFGTADNDPYLEDAIEAADPTGYYAWDDAWDAIQAWRAGKNTGVNAAWETLGAVPIMGKAKQMASAMRRPNWSGHIDRAQKFIGRVANPTDAVQDMWERFTR